MKNGFDKKYFMALLMFLLIGGRSFSQNLSDKNDKSEDNVSLTTDTINNKMVTLTHTAPFNAFGGRNIPKNPKIKFSNAQDALYAELWTFTNVIENDVKLVFAPLVVIKPFVRIKDKITLGFTTTQMIQNYLDNKSMRPMTHNMYAYASLKTKQCDVYINVGNFSILDYSSIHSKSMPVSTFFTNAIYLESGAYFPRAVVVGVDAGDTGLALGYMENGSGFKFDGVDGWAVCLMEIKSENSLRIGGLIKTNNKETMGNIHISGALTSKDTFLLQFLNIGARFACYGNICHEFSDNRTKASINAYYQSQDGVVGGDIMLRDSKSGWYSSFGLTKHSPFYEKMSDGTNNENWDKMMPFVEFGLIKPLFQKTQ